MPSRDGMWNAASLRAGLSAAELHLSPQLFHETGRHAGHQGVGGHVAVNHRAGCDDGSLADGHAGKDGASAPSDAVFDDHRLASDLDRAAFWGAGVGVVRAVRIMVSGPNETSLPMMIPSPSSR